MYPASLGKSSLVANFATSIRRISLLPLSLFPHPIFRHLSTFGIDSRTSPALSTALELASNRHVLFLTSNFNLPSPPRPRCLELLPPELFRDILDYFVQFPRAFPLDKAQQAVLLSLCLTSKRLLSFAQPVLFEAIDLNSESAVVQVAKRTDLLSHCRWMRWSLSTTDFSRDSKLEIGFRVILETATNLNDLTYYGSLRPSTVHVVANITKLHLSNLFISTTLALPFPHLKELSLYRVAAVTSLTPLRTLQNLPSLRHLATDDFDEKLIPGPISSQLISLAVHMESWSDIEDRKSRGHLGNATILYRCDLLRLGRNPAARSVEHLRATIDANDLAVLSFSSTETVTAIFDGWRELLMNAQPHLTLKSLYLPFLSSHRLLPFFSQQEQNAIDALVQTCGMLNIQVILEQPFYDPDFESLISPEFVRRSEIGAHAEGGG